MRLINASKGIPQLYSICREFPDTSEPQDNTKLSVEQPRTPSSTWLPYTLIDQLLLAASSQENASSRIQTLQSDLRTEISNRMKRVQRLTQQS